MRQHKHSRTHTHPILLSISVGNHVMCVFVSLGVVVFHCVHLGQSSITLFTRTHFLSAWEDRTVYLNHPPDGFRCIFGVITTCDALCSCFPFPPFSPTPFHQIHPFHPLTFIFFFLPSKSALLMVQDSKIVMLHPASLPLERRVPI